jgi:hypothetical protein
MKRVHRENNLSINNNNTEDSSTPPQQGDKK